MADSSEGGTKIKRNTQQAGPRPQGDPRVQQQIDPRDPRVQQQMQQAQQQMDPRVQQQMQQMQMQQQMQQPIDPMMLEQIIKRKSNFGSDILNIPVLKTSILVSVIFILLNSKMIWKQIIKLPMMGTVDPSILALIVNAILAGIVFYFINNFLISN